MDITNNNNNVQWSVTINN